MTFQDYFATLERSCDSTGEPQPGVLVWTPDENTPDIVYYQVSVGALEDLPGEHLKHCNLSEVLLSVNLL